MMLLTLVLGVCSTFHGENRCYSLVLLFSLNAESVLVQLWLGRVCFCRKSVSQQELVV